MVIIVLALCGIDRKKNGESSHLQFSVCQNKKISSCKGGDIMSKYDTLWKYVQDNGNQSFKLSFDEITEIAGTAIDHSFLKYKKELTKYGYQVGKISMKEQTVIFNKV